MLIKKELKKIPNCDCPEFTVKEIEKCKHIVAVKIVDVKNCGEILVADYFSTEGFNLQARFFCDKTNYITYIPTKDEWNTKALTTQFEGEVDIPCKEYDEDLVSDFLEISKPNWRQGYYINWQAYPGVHGILSEFIRQKGEAKAIRARYNKANFMKRCFDMLPKKYPAKVTDFLDDVAYKTTYIFFGNLDNKRKRKAICGHCGKTFSVSEDVKHKHETECPKCHKKAVYYAKRYSPKKESITLCIPSKYDNQLIFEWFKVGREYCGTKPVFEFESIARTFYLNNKGKPKIKSYGISCAPYYWGSHWADWGSNPVYRKAYVYTNDFKSIFGDRYYNINLYEVLKKQEYPIDFIALLDNLKNYPVTEYLCKKGLLMFASDYRINSDININGRSFEEVFDVRPNYYRMFVEKGVTLNEYYTIKHCKEFVTNEVFERYRMHELHEGIDTELLQYMTLSKLMNYMDKQLAENGYEINRSKIWLRDYIFMNIELGVQINKSIMFPSDIKKSHDLLLTRYKIVHAEIIEKESKEALQLVNEFFTEYSDDKFMIKIPKSRKDFVVEGEELHHCVGSDRYYTNHIKGNNMIFFIRQVDCPEKAYYTAEIDMHKFVVLQLYGMNDCKATKEVKNFTTEFAKWLKHSKSVMKKAS